MYIFSVCACVCVRVCVMCAVSGVKRTLDESNYTDIVEAIENSAPTPEKKQRRLNDDEKKQRVVSEMEKKPADDTTNIDVKALESQLQKEKRSNGDDVYSVKAGSKRSLAEMKPINSTAPKKKRRRLNNDDISSIVKKKLINQTNFWLFFWC